MNAHTFPALPKRSAMDLMGDLVRIYGELSASGDLSEAPTDLANDFDAGSDAARELLEWLRDEDLSARIAENNYDANDCGASAPYGVGV